MARPLRRNTAPKARNQTLTRKQQAALPTKRTRPSKKKPTSYKDHPLYLGAGEPKCPCFNDSDEATVCERHLSGRLSDREYQQGFLERHNARKAAF